MPAKHFASSNKTNLRAAVVLSGCGVFDGTEITEAVAMITTLSRNKVSVEYFAPNIDQMHVLDHTTGKEIDQKRNVMIESARITRGSINPIEELKVSNFDAIFFPGGFGAAKNLSTYATEGADMTVNADVKNILEEAVDEKINIGMCCISPIIAARVRNLFFNIQVFGKKFDGPGVTLTLGSKGPCFPYQDTIDVAEKFGNTIEHKDVSDMTIHKTYKNSVVSIL